MLGNVGKGVLTDGVDNGDDGEAHGKTHNQRVARVIPNPGGVVQPLGKITGEKGGLKRGVQHDTDVDGEHDQRGQEQEFHARFQPAAKTKGQQPPDT